MGNARRTMTNLAAAAVVGTGLGAQVGCQTPPAGFGGMTLPSPHYLKHPPQYFPPDPVFPLQRELDSMQDPEGVARRGGGVAPAPITPVPSVLPTPVPGGPAGGGVNAPGVGAGMPK